MGDEKLGIKMANSSRDRELLIPVAHSAAAVAVDDDSANRPSSSSSHHHSGREVNSAISQTILIQIFCF